MKRRMQKGGSGGGGRAGGRGRSFFSGNGGVTGFSALSSGRGRRR